MIIHVKPVNVDPDSGVMVDKHHNHVSSGTIDEKKESPSATEEEHAEYGMPNHTQQHMQHPAYNPYAQYPPHVIAAGMVPPHQVPPQQIYLQQHQLPLESQFQNMGFGDHASGGGGKASRDNSSNNSTDETSNGGGTNGNGDDINDQSDDAGDGQLPNEEGDDSDEEPIKLFVGQVPKTMNEEDIFPTFDSFGPLKDVSIIRDKHTQLHRGCAFVTYWAATDAEAAQEALHGKHVFPGARRPAQVKPAEPSVPENKLFIGMLSRKAGEDEIHELFAPFGEIREIFMIRNADGSSKCAAFLRYVGRDSAMQAIESLNNNLVMEGAARPLIVKFADNKHQRQQRHMRNVRRQELMTVMAAPATAYPGAYPAHHMAMGPPPGAAAHQYPAHMGGHPHHLPQYASHYPGPAGGGQMYTPMGYPPHHYGAAPHHYGGFARQGRGGSHHQSHPNGGVANTQANNPRPREGPAGANLFVYHLPHDLTDADLATAFNPFGNVISAKVYVDRFTGESKGFGFVSYDSVISAESAIEQMNGFQIGNKRLKVQHKRVHNNGGGNRGGQMVPEQQQQHQVVPQQAIPYEGTPAPDAVGSASPVEGGAELMP